MSKLTYKDAGVDVDEGARAVDEIKASVKETTRPEVVGGLGGFGALFNISAAKDMEEPLLVSGTDGVGTKLALAKRLGRHTTVGQDLVAMCVDDIVPTGGEPLFFLDYIALGKLKAEHVAEVVSGIAEGCKLSGCALIGGEMAEHPGVMAADDYDLAGFCVGVVDKPKMLGPELVREGDVIVGLPSSGIHSNAYSLVRAALTDKLSDEELEAEVPELGESLADALMRPTEIYALRLLKVLRAGGKIHAMAHITGGGITENLNRAMPEDLDARVRRGDTLETPWPCPAIIPYVAKTAGLDIDDAYRTLNMGVGMALVVPQDGLDDLLAKLKDEGFDPFVMGDVIKGSGKVVYA